jgi:hypothetical protein
VQADDQYDSEETNRRFEAALRGARLAKPVAMGDIPAKRQKKVDVAKKPATKSKRAGAADGQA